MTDQSQPDDRRRRAPAVVRVAVLAIVLAITGGVALVTGGLPPSGASGSADPSASAVETDAQGFPLQALGMPVATVGGALALIDADALSGRVLAVAGFWRPMFQPSCGPMPGRFMAPLERHCPGHILASRGYEEVTCRTFPDGRTECRTNQPPPGTEIINPLALDVFASISRLDAVAHEPLWRPTGVPAVIVGHAGDPRMWHCPGETRGECEREFVIDRVAWIAGDWLDVAADASDVVPGMAVEEAAAAAHVDTELLSALVMAARDAPTGDPRLHLVGEDPVWILRSIRPQQAAGEDPTRAVDVAVVDDGSGEVIASTGLEMSAAYQPARLLVQATEAGECCPGFALHPFYRVERRDGTAVLQSSLGGPASGTPDNTRTRFYAGLAAVLDPGDYVVRAWNATLAQDGSSGPPQDECTTDIAVEALGEARLEAQFPAEGSCSFVPPTFGDNMF